MTPFLRRLFAAAAFLTTSCAHAPEALQGPRERVVYTAGYRVAWDEGVREAPIWACMMDPSDLTGSTIMCADFGAVVEMYQKHQAEKAKESP